jgi:hypothetical protein
MLFIRNRSITNRISFLAAATLACALSISAQTVTAPAANETIKAADDFATLTFQDPWDMSQMTDLGWYTYGVDAPSSNLSSFSFSGGIFSATTSSSVPGSGFPNFWLLDPIAPTSAQIGKVGTVFPIDSSKYSRFVIRMNLSGPPGGSQSHLIWNLYGALETPARQQSTSNVFSVHPGQWIYSVDLTNLGVAGGPTWGASNPVHSLRVDPVFAPNINFQVDWVRLTNYDATLDRAITWTGSGQMDIFLDNDKNFANGYVGQIATGATGGSYTFNVGGLPAGTYYVAIRPTAGGAVAYSNGAWTVDDIPTLTFTSPNPEGSADDFATTQLGNPWDMNTPSDIDFTLNVTGTGITNLATAQDEAGNPFSNVRVYSGTTASSNYADPEVFPLFWNGRGATTHIDTSRYRILSIKWGILRPRDLNLGSVGRVVWRVFGENVENVSDDFNLHHLGTANVIQNIIADMKSLPLAWGGSPPHFGGGSPSTTGWNGMLDSFRIKPDEFSSATNFYIQYVKLSAFEQADASYTMNWNYTNAGTAAPTLQLAYDNTGTGFAGTQIAAGLNPTTGSYVWNTSALPNGTYYIYARIMNGATVMNQTYARWPINVIHGGGSLPTITLDRSHLYFGATNNGGLVTSSQAVNVTTTSGVAWTASSNQPFVTVNPTSGTGTGSFTVTVQGTTFPSPSTQNATVTVNAGGATNSPQTVQVSLNVMNPAAVLPPFGSFDTPLNNTTGIAGNIAVTGWALDGIETIKVDIWREPMQGETPSASGLSYVGDAAFVDGARSDIATTYSTEPINTRAGWGYMMLTNFLPNGNGTFNIHAIAHNSYGQSTDLGVKTIVVDNMHASKPFGTIDTPAQGGSSVSGTAYVNFGWALTQMPNCIPVDGSTIQVYVDGVAKGNPTYNRFRSDIASLFPNRCNTNGAVGFSYIDTTQLSNGVHTLSWSVTDNAGHTDGIGSRYISVFNSGPVAAPADLGSAAGISSDAIATPAAITLRLGLDRRSKPELLDSQADGSYLVNMDEVSHIELEIGAVKGYHVINGQTRSLPIGSTLKDGVFYWEAGPGFLGPHELRFERSDGTVATVHVNIQPKTPPRRRVRE